MGWARVTDGPVQFGLFEDNAVLDNVALAMVSGERCSVIGCGRHAVWLERWQLWICQPHYEQILEQSKPRKVTTN